MQIADLGWRSLSSRGRKKSSANQPGSRWLANTTFGDQDPLESSHDETRFAAVIYLVKISLPSLVACSRYKEPLCMMPTLFPPLRRSALWSWAAGWYASLFVRPPSD